MVTMSKKITQKIIDVIIFLFFTHALLFTEKSLLHIKFSLQKLSY